MKQYNQILKELNSIFHEVFKDNTLVIVPETTADNILGWDSLTHMVLISEIEKHFKCEFSFGEVMGFNNVGDIVLTIQQK